MLDQIEALAQNTPDKIQQIDIDHWNAAQIAARSNCPVAKVRKEWVQSTIRARSMIDRLPDEMWSRRAVVPWTKEPVSPEDLSADFARHIQIYLSKVQNEFRQGIVDNYGQEMYDEVERGITLWRDASAAGKVGRDRLIGRKSLI